MVSNSYLDSLVVLTVLLVFVVNGLDILFVAKKVFVF